MGKHLSIRYKEENFWVYDVVASVLLKFLIDAANDQLKLSKNVWLKETIEQWKVNAIFSDFGFYLDENWTEEQLEQIKEIISKACKTLVQKDKLSKKEIAEWTILDEQGIDLRDEKEILTESIVKLAKAINELLEETLPKAPEGHWWFYGTEGKTTIKKES